MRDIVSMRVDNRIFEGFETFDWNGAIFAAAANFSLNAKTNEKISTGSAVKIYIDQTLLVSGFIDQARGNTNAYARTLSLSGRDKTCDLIDCSVPFIKQWKNQNLATIANEVCKPFGIKVLTPNGFGSAFANVSVEPGETCFDLIGRLAKLRGLLAGSNANGDLVLSRPDVKPAQYSLITGENLSELSFIDNAADRFSKYEVKGQHSFAGSFSPKDASAAMGNANDPMVKRFRPKMIISDEQSTIAGLNTRAKFEATKALANSQSFNCQIPSWRNPNDELFYPGQTARIISKIDEIDMVLLLSEVRFSLSPSQKTTDLTFVRPEAFAIEPIEEKAPKTPVKPKSKKVVKK